MVLAWESSSMKKLLSSYILSRQLHGEAAALFTTYTRREYAPAALKKLLHISFKQSGNICTVKQWAVPNEFCMVLSH
jgi:hypothetical protein